MNPFRETIVASPWNPTCVDLPTIHGPVFNECLGGIDFVRHNQRSAALLLHGEAGSGKTHLLSRLRARLTPHEPSATDREESLYVWVRLQTSPRMIWRTLRRTLVDDWFRPVAGVQNQFQRILFHRLAQIRPAEGDLERWYEYMLDEQPDGLAELIDQIADTLDLDRNTAVAFKHIAFGRHLRDLRGWLAGASLPQPALDRLDLSHDDGTDEEREDESRQIVLMLCRLAGNGLPIVLSFDQVEALQTHPGDRDALFAFGQLVSTLHDGTTNVLLVSCVQSAFATELKDHARSADYDRMTSLGALSLHPLSRAQAGQLIAARLAAAVQPAAPDAARSATWPLEPGEFHELFATGHVSPRRLLGLCAERYDAPAERESIAAQKSMEAFLRNKWDSSVQQKAAANSPEKTEEIVRHGLPLLVRLIAPEAAVVGDELLPDVALVFEEAGRRSGLSVCNQANMNSLAARLKRLKRQLATGRLARLVLVKDARVPLSPTANAARGYLAELEEKGAVVVIPSTESLAALDALRELVSDAKSGDLDCQGQPVPPQAVGEWLAANVSKCLHELVDDVLDRPAASARTSASGTRAATPAASPERRIRRA
jgi:hypothetical protein